MLEVGAQATRRTVISLFVFLSCYLSLFYYYSSSEERFSQKKKNKKKQTIFVLEGKTPHHGLADILSAICNHFA